MADSDSFIHEVTEEVRRDRLFAFFRRWGWLMALAVVVLVGTAAYFEWRSSQEQASAQAFGDAVIRALDSDDAGERQAALEAVATDGPGAEMLRALLIAGEEAQAGDAEGAAERLRAIADREDMPERYRDLARLKAQMLDPGDRAEALAMLDRMAQPGAPYRALAIEQQAYMALNDGDVDGALELLRDLQSDAEASPGLQQRVAQVIVAVESGASLVDEPLPEPEAGADPAAAEDAAADGPDTADPVDGDGAEAPAEEE
ncbi:tetratricopeptide repeat protein [Rhodobacterales bacterium HKCCE3408]|nr:tetratricopeptide repeat protein [Rhodobacterales bacterium HKCCE3408]